MFFHGAASVLYALFFHALVVSSFPHQHGLGCRDFQFVLTNSGQDLVNILGDLKTRVLVDAQNFDGHLNPTPMIVSDLRAVTNVILDAQFDVPVNNDQIAVSTGYVAEIVSTLISGLEKYSVPKLMSIVGQTDAALAGLITSIDQVGAPLQSALVAALEPITTSMLDVKLGLSVASAGL